MEQELELPAPYSAFIRKRDAAYDGDPNGDYVLSQHVNELQESIERLERIINIEALDDTVSDELERKIDKATVSDFGSPLFINYGGSSIGTYDTVEKRIHAFSYIPRVMLRKEASSDFPFLVKEIKKSGTRLYGIVTCQGTAMNVIEADIQWFKGQGFHGVLLAGFGFEGGLTRSAQNQALQLVHSLGMAAIVTGEIESTLFGKPHESNPQQEPLMLTPDDAYLTQDVFVINGEKNNPIVIPSIVFSLNKAQKELGIQILVEDTANAEEDNNSLYLYGKMLATLYNVDGYSLAPRSRYALNERVQRYLHGFELGQWKDDAPIFVEDAVSTSRRFAKGTIVFDKAKNTSYIEGIGLSPTIYTWQDKQIPGTAVNLETADFNDAALNNLVDAINNGEHLIHYSKIDGLDETGATPSLINQSVIRAINTSPAAVQKNGDGGYDEMAGNSFIHGGLVDYIDASSIKSGSLSVDALKANVVYAINGHFERATIDAAYIGELSAEHIAATVVDAINIYAKNAQLGNALIDNAAIGQLKAGHIKAEIIQAINASIEEAVIDSAQIGTLTAGHIKAEVIKAINASIGDATIDSAKIGTLEAKHIQGMVVDAIKLYAGDAKIESAHIGALKASNIAAGLVEALEISASKAEFDTLKAAVINAINASLENAFIDGAIIKQGTIDEVQIADGSITDAKIVELVANKIISGTIDTSKVTLQGDNGHLRISGNKLQVFDDQEVPVERVSIGDVDGDGNIFGMRIRGEDGVTVLYDEKGVYSEGITDGAITNPKIAEDAVDGGKHIHANTITGDKMVVEAITAREIKAKTITANEMAVGAITAGSAIIAKGAIGEAEIAEASIGTAHVKELSATKLTAGSIQLTSRNLVPNATFKKGLIDWQLSAALSIGEISDIVKLNTTRSLHLFSTGQTEVRNLGAGSKFVAASAGENYAASVYVLTRNLNSYDLEGPSVHLEFYNGSNWIQSFEAYHKMIQLDKWERIAVLGTAPTGTTQVRIRIGHPKNGDTFFARPMLQRGNIVTEWTGDGSYMTEDGVYTGELHADQITAGKIKADLIVVGPDTSFESGYSPGELREEMEDRIPYTLRVMSTNGDKFMKGHINSTLVATVHRGKDDITDQIDASRFIWKRVSMDTAADEAWAAAHKGMKNVPITTNDVYRRATFLCELMDE